jgi:hypothetical protein
VLRHEGIQAKPLESRIKLLAQVAQVEKVAQLRQLSMKQISEAQVPFVALLYPMLHVVQFEGVEHIKQLGSVHE